jgi:AMMECR1 domain-containing protein
MFFILIIFTIFQQSCLAEVPSLTELVRQTMQNYFAGKQINKADIKSLVAKKPEFNKPAGVFVTLSENGKTRACWGSIEPMQSNIIESTIYGTINALKKDYRHKPVKSTEWKNLKPQVTIIKEIKPIYSIKSQNPLIDGLLIEGNNKSALLLPGEASDPYYQLVQCKLKAGIHNGESYKLYRIKAQIYE